MWEGGLWRVWRGAFCDVFEERCVFEMKCRCLYLIAELRPVVHLNWQLFDLIKTPGTVCYNKQIQKIGCT